MLSNAEKRKIYDEYGEEGLKGGGEGGMHNPMDIFEMFFGGGGGFFSLFFEKQTTNFYSGFSRGEKPTKVRDTVHQMTVPLEKMYNGCTKRLRIQRFGRIGKFKRIFEKLLKTCSLPEMRWCWWGEGRGKAVRSVPWARGGNSEHANWARDDPTRAADMQPMQRGRRAESGPVQALRRQEASKRDKFFLYFLFDSLKRLELKNEF